MRTVHNYWYHSLLAQILKLDTMLANFLKLVFLDVKILVTLLLLIITIRTFRRFKDHTAQDTVEGKDSTANEAGGDKVPSTGSQSNTLSLESASNDAGDGKDYSSAQYSASTSIQKHEVNNILVDPQISENEKNDCDEVVVATNGATAADRSTPGVSTTNTSNTAPNSDLISDEDSENWRCVCETGFLPPGLLKSFGGMEAMVRMSTGQCYHKTA